MDTEVATRRALLRGSVTAAVIGVTGCTINTGGSDIKDTDDDGVIDSEDYAPRDPEVQEKSDLLGTETEDTRTKTEGRSGKSITGVQPTEGLKGYWSFESISDRTVPDESGHDHDGTIQGDPQPISGAVGQALAFDGKDDSVKVDMTPELQTTGSFTLELWVQTMESTDGGRPLGLYTYNGNGQGEETFISAKSNRIGFHARHSTGFGQAGGGAENDPYYHIPGEPLEITPSRWHHIALKYDRQAQTIAMYVDGEPEFSLSAPKDPRVDDTYLTIGAEPASGTSDVAKEHFTGGIDEVLVYTQALSDETIQQHADRANHESDTS